MVIAGFVSVWSHVASAADSKPAEAIEARAVFFRLRDIADVPALERGVLRELNAEAGDIVQESQLLASLDDAETSLNLDLAKLDLAIAEKRQKESVAVSVAEATYEEAVRLLQQARLELEVAQSVASSDISIRNAAKEAELSQTELDRAVAARKEFSSSVSDQTLGKLTLTRDKNQLLLEKAKLDQSLDVIRSRSKESIVEQQQAAVGRLKSAIAEAQTEAAVSLLTVESLRKTVAIAEERLSRRALRAPFSGMVVEKIRNRGEWVNAGEPVLKVLRLDRLYVEGYVETGIVSISERGKSVRVEALRNGRPVSIEGKIVFINPQIDAINQSVLIRAEIENPDFHFLPGQPARMWLPAPAKE